MSSFHPSMPMGTSSLEGNDLTATNEVNSNMSAAAGATVHGSPSERNQVDKETADNTKSMDIETGSFHWEERSESAMDSPETHFDDEDNASIDSELEFKINTEPFPEYREEATADYYMQRFNNEHSVVTRNLNPQEENIGLFFNGSGDTSPLSESTFAYRTEEDMNHIADNASASSDEYIPVPPNSPVSPQALHMHMHSSTSSDTETLTSEPLENVYQNEHSDSDGGVAIGNVTTLYEELAKLRLETLGKGRKMKRGVKNLPGYLWGSFDSKLDEEDDARMKAWEWGGSWSEGKGLGLGSVSPKGKSRAL